MTRQIESLLWATVAAGLGIWVGVIAEAKYTKLHPVYLSETIRGDVFKLDDKSCHMELACPTRCEVTFPQRINGTCYADDGVPYSSETSGDRSPIVQGNQGSVTIK